MGNKQCYIVGAGEFENAHIEIKEENIIIAADGGLKYLEDLKILPDVVVGDFDSYGRVPEYENLIVHPVRKDDTDLELAMSIGYEKGYNDFRLYGVCGGRVDHTIANIQMAFGYAQKACRVFLFGVGYTCLICGPGKITFNEDYKGTISVFALSELVEEVTIKGLDYETDRITLKNTDPMGVSNGFTGKESTIEFTKGQVMIVWYENGDSSLPNVEI